MILENPMSTALAAELGEGWTASHGAHLVSAGEAVNGHLKVQRYASGGCSAWLFHSPPGEAPSCGVRRLPAGWLRAGGATPEDAIRAVVERGKAEVEVAACALAGVPARYAPTAVPLSQPALTVVRALGRLWAQELVREVQTDDGILADALIDAAKWHLQTFPGAHAQEVGRKLVEEAAELALALGTPRDELIARLDKTCAKVASRQAGDPDEARRDEVADVAVVLGVVAARYLGLSGRGLAKLVQAKLKENRRRAAAGRWADAVPTAPPDNSQE